MTDLHRRIFEFAKSLQLINFATVTENGRPRVRYVVGRADEALVVRFSTHLDSDKVRHLRENPHVCLTLGAADVAAPQWLQIDGRAEVSTAERERRGFWFEGLRRHFTGLDDPRYCVVVVTPSRIALGPEVWDPTR
jgi:general stress protein 26